MRIILFCLLFVMVFVFACKLMQQYCESYIRKSDTYRKKQYPTIAIRNFCESKSFKESYFMEIWLVAAFYGYSQYHKWKFLLVSLDAIG